MYVCETLIPYTFTFVTAISPKQLEYHFFSGHSVSDQPK